MALKFEELRVLQAAEVVDAPMPLFTRENLEWLEAIPNT
jgi:hypothetical protein